MKWPDIIIDYGRELYIPWQLGLGKTLYRDIAFFNGPLSVYTHMWLFRVFGNSLRTIVMFNLILTGSLAAMLYRFFYKLSDEWTAFTVTITFLGIFGFGQYSPVGVFNFVCPYSHELTHAIFFSILSLSFFCINARFSPIARYTLAGFFWGCVFLLKTEVVFALSISLLTGISITLFRRETRQFMISFTCLVAGFLSAIGAMTALLAIRISIPQAFLSILFPYKAILNKSVSTNFFYRTMMGWDKPLRNTGIVVLSSIIWLMIIYFLGILAGFIEKKSSLWRRVAISFFVLGIPVIIWTSRYAFFWKHTIRGISILGVLMCAWLIRKMLYGGHSYENANKQEGLLLFGVFSVFLTLKVMLNINVISYGFALGMPATLFVIGVTLHHHPLLFKPSLERVKSYRFFIFYAVLSIVFLHVLVSGRVFARKIYPLTWEQNIFLDINRLKPTYIQNTLDQIKLLVPPDATMVVFPEGVILNYLSRRTNPTPYVNFMPIELLLFEEKTILQSLIETRPDFVVFVDRKTAEYGADYFGRDYGILIFNWLKENYEEIWRIGGVPLTGDPFGIQICRYKNR